MHLPAVYLPNSPVLGFRAGWGGICVCFRHIILPSLTLFVMLYNSCFSYWFGVLFWSTLCKNIKGSHHILVYTLAYLNSESETCTFPKLRHQTLNHTLQECLYIFNFYHNIQHTSTINHSISPHLLRAECWKCMNQRCYAGRQTERQRERKGEGNMRREMKRKRKSIHKFNVAEHIMPGEMCTVQPKETLLQVNS